MGESAGPLKYSTWSAACLGVLPVKRMQISGSAPTQRQSWTNSSRPALPGSRPPQQVVNGTRLAGSPIVAVHSKPSVVLPPKRMMPGLRALRASATSRRQPKTLSVGISET